MKLRFAKSSWHFKLFIPNFKSNATAEKQKRVSFLRNFLICKFPKLILKMNPYINNVWHFVCANIKQVSFSSSNCQIVWVSSWRIELKGKPSWKLPGWKILEYLNVCESCKAKEIRYILIMCVFCFNCNCKPEPNFAS